MFCGQSAIVLALSGLGLLHAQSRGAVASATDRMAFVGRQNAVSHILLMDVDASGEGANPARLTNDGDAENYPSWSPDGKRLLYQRDRDGSAIYVMDADGTGQQRLSPVPGFDATPSWSPDGTQIVYARLLATPQPDQLPATDIQVMNADGTGDHTILAGTLFSVEPRWSVNNQMVFMSLMSGSGSLQIYEMNADGTDVRQLTSEGNNGDPVWSPDGTRVAFGSDREGGNQVNLFSMDADGGQLQQLTHFDAPYEAGDANWSSDGTKIAFQYDIGGMKQSDSDAYAEVWTMNPDGSGQASTGVQCSDVGCAPRWRPVAARTASPLINSGGIVIHGGASTWVSPGSLVDIYGSNMAATAVSAPTDAALPVILNGVQVLVNGAPAPLVYVSASQIIFQAPYETAIGVVSVVVLSINRASVAEPMTVRQAAPGILTYDANRAVVVNQDNTVNAPDNGAKPGSVVVAYLIGSGTLDNPIATGAAAPLSPLSRESLETTVSVGGSSAALQFAGMTPGFAGLVQMNFVIPNLAPGDYALRITIGDEASNEPLLTVSR